MKYIAIEELGIKYKVPEKINIDELSKLLATPNRFTIYLVCELLGLEREKLEDEKQD